MDSIEVIKILSLFISVWLTSINVVKFIRVEDLHWGNFILMAAGITGFIYLQWLM